MNVVIVGCGIAGLSAALNIAQKGGNVTLVSSHISERAQSVMAAGGINAALDLYNENDNPIEHMKDTISGGCYIENEDSVLSLTNDAKDIIDELVSFGVVFSRDKKGELVERIFGGHKKHRTLYAGASTGKQIVTALIQKVREYEIKGQITRKSGKFFHSALIKDNKCYGVLMINSLTGEVYPYYADYVVIATGGLNKLFGKTTGTELCDGYTTGKLFTQGVKLKNLEFIQYHPTTIETSHKRMLISECARSEGGRLYYLDDDNKRVYFMEEKYGELGNLQPRDIVSKCMFDCKRQVYLDVSFLNEKVIHERLEEIYDLCKTYRNLDITKEPIPVEPSVHFFMGGIDVDDNHETNIKNLYAIGECSSKYHGANRLGGNSLLSAIYSGKVVSNVINYQKSKSDFSIFDSYIEDVKSDINKMKESKSLFPSVYILNDIAEVMNTKLGIVRNKKNLNDGIKEMNHNLKILESICFDPNVSIYENYRLLEMAILAKAILMCAKERQESRGAHIREDYKETLDEYKKATIVEYLDKKITISYRDENGK